MFTYTSEEVELAATQFCRAIEIWTECFVGAGESPSAVERTPDGLYPLRDEARERLGRSRFVTNIAMIYPFAKTGVWEGKYIFEDREALEDELIDPLTELSAFTEVYSKDRVNFHDTSGEDILDVSVAGENIIRILNEVIDMAFSRFNLITGGVLELERLAMLADVSLKTVRNAVSAKGEGRLVLSEVTVDGKPCVDADEAMRWLEKKKGYQGPYIINEVPGYKAYDTLGQLQYHIIALMRRESIDWDSLKEKAGWGPDLIEAYKKLAKLKIDNSLGKVTPESLKQLGSICHVEDLEAFVCEGSKIVAAARAQNEAEELFQ